MQSNGSTTTRYTQDLASSLSQVLNSGGANYVYGAERLFASTDGMRTWHAADALGSVRQTLSDAGAVLGTTSYDPWGVVESGTSAPFGFTGELQDGNNVYLRARWYNASAGQFTGSRWGEDESSITTPYSHHQYAYALSNPVLLSDPAGTCSTYGNGDDYCRPELNPRDITLWLYRAMLHNIRDARLLNIRALNSFPTWPVGLASPCPEPFSFAVTRGLALTKFRELVTDKGPWDFKHKIREQLGFGVTICSTVGCRDDLEYSVAGNIHYGFVGRAGGFPVALLAIGAGVAEFRDPAHDEERAKENEVPYTGPYDLDGKLGPQETPFGSIVVLGDDPVDNYATHFGMYLYDKYRSSLTYPQFRDELVRVAPQLATQSPDADAVDQRYARNWPYHAEYFNWP